MKFRIQLYGGIPYYRIDNFIYSRLECELLAKIDTVSSLQSDFDSEIEC